MTKSVQILANVPVRMNVNPNEAGLGEHPGSGAGTGAGASGAGAAGAADANRLPHATTTPNPAMTGGEDPPCGSTESCRIQLPVTLVLEVRIKADCRVRDIHCGNAANC